MILPPCVPVIDLAGYEALGNAQTVPNLHSGPLPQLAANLLFRATRTISRVFEAGGQADVSRGMLKRRDCDKMAVGTARCYSHAARLA